MTYMDMVMLECIQSLYYATILYMLYRIQEINRVCAPPLSEATHITVVRCDKYSCTWEETVKVPQVCYESELGCARR